MKQQYSFTSIVAFVIFFVGLAEHAQAQEMGIGSPRRDDVVKVTAVAQFAEGHITRTEPSLQQSDVVYQTALYEGDRVETKAGSVVKFASRSGCLFVLRGEGAIASPADKKPWRMRGESVRLICSPRYGHASLETFGISNVPLIVKDGEILFLNKKANEKSPFSAILLSGAATLLGQPLELHKLYKVESSALTEADSQPSDEELRQLNLDENPPRESFIWPAADKKYTIRVILGPVISSDRVIYDSSDLSQGGLKSTNPRLQVHVRTSENRSKIFAVTFRETEDGSGGYGPNGKPADGLKNSLSQILLEFGYRNRHDRWWSPYWRVGAGHTRANIYYTKPDPYTNGWSSAKYADEFYVLSAAYGLDAHLTPHFLRPFGLYLGAEGQIIQSLFRASRSGDISGGNAISLPAEPSRLTDVNVSVFAGIQYDF